MRHQQAKELLPDQFRRLAAQYNLSAAQVGLQFVQGGLSGKGLARC
jgi:hypothetical protein